MSSPSNPTGGMLSSDQLRELCEVCKKNGIVFISDEIYHGITYGTQKEATAVSLSDSVGEVRFSRSFSCSSSGSGSVVVDLDVIMVVVVVVVVVVWIIAVVMVVLGKLVLG